MARVPLPACGGFVARIEQPEPCAARWDRFVARELGWPRSRVEREAARGALRVNGAGDLRRVVADGDELSCAS